MLLFTGATSLCLATGTLLAHALGGSSNTPRAGVISDKTSGLHIDLEGFAVVLKEMFLGESGHAR